MLRLSSPLTVPSPLILKNSITTTWSHGLLKILLNQRVLWIMQNNRHTLSGCQVGVEFMKYHFTMPRAAKTKFLSPLFLGGGAAIPEVDMSKHGQITPKLSVESYCLR